MSISPIVAYDKMLSRVAERKAAERQSNVDKVRWALSQSLNLETGSSFGEVTITNHRVYESLERQIGGFLLITARVGESDTAVALNSEGVWSLNGDTPEVIDAWDETNRMAAGQLALGWARHDSLDPRFSTQSYMRISLEDAERGPTASCVDAAPISQTQTLPETA